MKQLPFMFLCVLGIAGAPADATTWGSKTVIDPISGSECEVRTPASSGSYIYDWPSKYDGVFWPYTEFSWLWYCPASGYVSFGDDFSEVNGDERVRIAALLENLKHALPAERDLTTRLWLADRIYALRDKDDEWRAWYMRVRAQLLDILADEARRASIPLLTQSFASRGADVQVVIDRLVLARYLHCFDYGSDGGVELEKARKMVPQLSDVHADTRDYLLKLANDIEQEMSECRSN